MTAYSSDLLMMLGAVVLAAIGGELFLKGVLAVAAWLRVPKLIVATSLAAIATSSPELKVSSIAALAGRPEIGLNDSLGINVVNIALIFGVALIFAPVRVQWQQLRRDFVLALIIALLSFWFSVNAILSRIEGGLLLMIFVLSPWVRRNPN